MFRLRHRQVRRSASCLAAALLFAFFVAPPNSNGASETWNGTQNNNWIPSQTGNNKNWATNHSFPGAVDTTTNTDTATFNITKGSPTLITLNPSLVSGTTLNIGSITFDLAAVGAFTIGTTGGPILVLSSGGTIQMTSTVANNETINAPISLAPVSSTTAGSYTFTNNSSTTADVLTFGGGITGGTTSSAVTLTLNGSNTGNNTISGVIGNGSASGGVAVTKSGTGTWILSGATANTYTGLTTVNAGELDLNKNANTLAVAGNLTIGDGAGGGANSDIVKLLASGQISSTAAVLINGTSGKLDLNGNNQTIGSLADTGTVTANGSSVNLSNGATGGTLTVGNSTNTTFSGAITGTNGNLAKAGTGTLTLEGNSTYSGTTTINSSGGTLKIDNNGTATSAGKLANTSGITVNSGGTLLLSGVSSVTDRINNGATVNLASGGSPGTGGKFNTGGLSEGTAPTGGVGTGAVGMGALTLNSNSTIDFNAPGNSSTAGGSNLVFQSLASFVSGTALTIAHWTGNANQDGLDRLLFATNPGLTLAQLANVQFTNDAGTLFALGGREITFNGMFEIVPVPEPSTWLAAALALGAIGFSQRKRVRGMLKTLQDYKTTHRAVGRYGPEADNRTMNRFNNITL